MDGILNLALFVQAQVSSPLSFSSRRESKISQHCATKDCLLQQLFSGGGSQNRRRTANLEVIFSGLCCVCVRANRSA